MAVGISEAGNNGLPPKIQDLCSVQETWQIFHNPVVAQGYHMALFNHHGRKNIAIFSWGKFWH